MRCLGRLRTLCFAALGLLAACSAAPRHNLAMLPGAGETPRLEGVRGPLSAQESKAILERLAREAPDADLLRRHLAIEEAIADNSIVLGNKARILADGDTSFAAMAELIRGAKHHLNLEYFIFEDVDLGGGQLLVDMLIAKRRQGVQVNVIYDSLGSSDTPDEVFERLKGAGVKLVSFNKPVTGDAPSAYSPANRDHRKILIADGKAAITGGINMSKVYSSSVLSGGSGGGDKAEAEATGDRWHDISIRIDGPAAADFQKLFMETWESHKGEKLTDAGYFPKFPKPVGDIAVRVIGSDPVKAAPLFYLTLLSAMQHAESKMWLATAYFAPQPDQVAALKAAAQRGVDVRLLLSNRSDWEIAMDAGRSFYSELLEAGVRIFELNDAILHSKTAVIDGVWTAIGSSNLDSLSAGFNAEIDVVALGAEPAKEMEAMYEKDLANATEITREAWRERGIGQRFRELLGRAVAYWL